MNRIVSLLRMLVPSAIQLAVVVTVLLTAFFFYGLGASSEHRGAVADGAQPPTSASTSPANAPEAPHHPADLNGDGIIYTCSMHPQIQQDEPGDCPICGMDLVPIKAAPAPPAKAPELVHHPADLNGDGIIYTCSMHPQIQQDEPGDCPICGMDLVPIKAAPAPPAKAPETVHHPADLNGDGIIYTCSMHPQIQQDEPGDCPICGMDLVPIKVAGSPASGNAGTSGATAQLTLTKEAVALASIQTSLVMRMTPMRTLRLVGQLAVDPSRRVHISANVGGRIDKLTARYEGDVVEKGQDLVLLYSPELLAVQKEFVQARATLDRLPAGALDSVRRSSESAIDAARERLRLAGLNEAEIDAIAQSGKAREQVTLTAPIGGTVLARQAEEGEYVSKGETILTIADLHILWAELAAYESDLPWLRIGQVVQFTNDAFPGKTFQGEVAWIDPLTDVKTRTTRVRLDVANKEGLLRPGMYLSATTKSELGEGEMLVIPSGAPLITGKRAVVYTKVPDVESPTYEGREIVLGPRVDDGYIVESGLADGEEVVTQGAFRIDSALQILARPSMMNPQGGGVEAGHSMPGMPGMSGMSEHEEGGSTP